MLSYEEFKGAKCTNVLELRHRDEAKIFEVIKAYCNRSLLSYLNPAPSGDSSITWYIENWGTTTDIDCDYLFYFEKLHHSLFAVCMTFTTFGIPPYRAYDAAAAQHGFEVAGSYNFDDEEVCGVYFPGKEDLHRYYGDINNNMIESYFDRSIN